MKILFTLFLTSVFVLTVWSQTIPLDQEVTVCEGSFAELEIPIALIAGVETEYIIADPTGTAIININTRKVEVNTTGLTAGQYDIIYEIDNTVYGTRAATLTVNVIAIPDLNLVTPTTSSLLVGTSRVLLEINSTTSDVGYRTNWVINSGQGLLSTPTQLSTDLTGLLARDPSAHSTTNLTVCVSDVVGLCLAACESFDITRVDQTIPLDAEITVCEGSLVELNIPSVLIAGIETESIIEDPTGTAIINKTTRKVEVNTTGLTAGQYDIIYEIDNTVTGLVTATLTVNVDEQIGNVELTENPINTCTTSITLSATTPTPSTAKGLWTITSQPVGQSAVLFDTKSPRGEIHGLTQGVTVLDWIVTNGVCPSVKVMQTINQVGEITNPSIIVEGATKLTQYSYEMCVGDVANINANTRLKPSESLSWIRGFTGSDPNQSYTGAAGTNIFSIELEVASIVPGCSPASTVFNFTVKDVPNGGNLVLTDGCEGTEVTANIEGVTGATGYSWTNLGTQNTSEKTTEVPSATFKLLVGADSEYHINVTPFNSCGEGDPISANALIVKQPLITFLSPSGFPYLALTNSVALEVSTNVQVGSGYSVGWVINSGQGALSTPNQLTTGLIGLSLKDPYPNSTTNLTVCVSDVGGVCPAACETLDILRIESDPGDPTGIRDEIEKNTHVLPNPFTTEAILQFENTANEVFSLRIVNLNGVIVEEQAGISGSEVTLKGEKWTSGMYLYSLTSATKSYFGKMLVE